MSLINASLLLLLKASLAGIVLFTARSPKSGWCVVSTRGLEGAALNMSKAPGGLKGAVLNILKGAALNMSKTSCEKRCVICSAREFEGALSNVLLKGCRRGVALMSLYSCKGNCLGSPGLDLWDPWLIIFS
jgi:hypothetical protein